METINFINNVARMVFINIFSYVVFIKMTNFKENNLTSTTIIIVISILEAILCSIVYKYISKFIAILIIYTLYSFVISRITKNKFEYSIIVTFISLTMVYLIYIISIIIFGVISKLILPTIASNNIVILVFIGIIESFTLYVFFKAKRFRNGVSFLNNKEKVNNVGILGFAFIGIALLIFSLFDLSKGKDFRTYLAISVIIEAICLTIWIRRKITKHYKQKMKERTIEELENEIKEKDEEIGKILEENNAIATINHKYSSRIRALEKFSAEILSKPDLVETMKVEFGADFGDIQDQIKKLSKEYSSEIKEKIKHENKLAKTGIFGIDNMLEYMKDEAEKNNIKFDLKLTGNINYMIENVIEQSKLETLLGDHLKDAIIAINHSDNTYKSILTTIGIVEDCYEIRIYDTGIEFEIETLHKLGLERITTHKESGGSGIGFMTTFETLRECKASLIIEEYGRENTNFTKSVIIRFDNKNEYKICSYRAEEIEKQRKDDRIIIEKILNYK